MKTILQLAVRRVNNEKTAIDTANKNHFIGEFSHSVWSFTVCGVRLYFSSSGTSGIATNNAIDRGGAGGLV
jgi:hypothetical protein